MPPEVLHQTPRIIIISPSKRKAQRRASAELTDRIRPFRDPNYFGYCDACNQEGHLRPSASNLECARPICKDCLDRFNGWGKYRKR